MFSLLNSLLLATAFQSVYGQFFGGGGSTFGGGFNGFGCGSYVPTVGNECYQPETGKGTVVCVCKYFSIIIDLTSSYRVKLVSSKFYKNIFLFQILPFSHWILSLC